MPIWKTLPVNQEPELSLIIWRIMQTEQGERHFVGIRDDDSTGRVSSAIVEFDAHTRRGVTRSGRVYQLCGKPGFSADAQYVWSRWCLANSVFKSTDVTNIALDTMPGPHDGNPP